MTQTRASAFGELDIWLARAGRHEQLYEKLGAHVVENGVRFAVCSLATRGAANVIAQKTGQSVDAAFKELTDNLIPNGHMVPAGIVAVNRAQERGYTFTYVG